MESDHFRFTKKASHNTICMEMISFRFARRVLLPARARVDGVDQVRVHLLLPVRIHRLHHTSTHAERTVSSSFILTHRIVGLSTSELAEKFRLSTSYHGSFRLRIFLHCSYVYIHFYCNVFSEVALNMHSSQNLNLLSFRYFSFVCVIRFITNSKFALFCI